MKYLLPATMLLACAAPAVAQQDGGATGAWTVKSERAIVAAGGISLPTRPGTLSLTKTSEASNKGQGLDNVATFRSEDSAVLASVYIFFTSYADTALATWATDRAVRQSYGPDVVLIDDRMADVAGVRSAATRRIYDKVALPSGAKLVSAAGFLRAGSWLVGLRVSGPVERRAEIEAGFDALLAGLRFEGDAKPFPAAPLKIAAPCPVGPEKPAKYLSDKKAGATAFFTSLLGGSITVVDQGKTKKLDTPLAFPANGAKPLCVRGTIVEGTTRQDVLQPARAEDGEIVLIPIDDAGGIVTVEPVLLGDGYVVKQYGIGFTDVMGSFRTMPSLAQIGAILGGRDSKGGTIRTRTTFTPDGKSTTSINSDALK